MRLTTLFFLLLASLSLQAQPAAYHKLSPFVREVATIARAEQRRAPQNIAYGDRELSAFVRTEGNPEAMFRRYGVRRLATFGSIHIVSIPLRSLSPLSLDPHVLRIESYRTRAVTMDSTRTFVDAQPVYEGRALPQAFTGEGVVVGMQDVGFDLTHPTFYTRDLNRYRIQAFWDQLSPDTLGSTLYVGREYRGKEELLRLGCAYDGRIQSHGTHTAGIAAGSGYDSPYIGMAPDADLCLVCNATNDDLEIIDSTQIYKYTTATDALGFKYIFDYAQSVGKPCVINFSEGGAESAHDEAQLYYEVLDSLVGPGRILVASAGNAGERLTYFRKPKGEEHAGLFVASDGSRGTATLRSSDSFTIRVTTYADMEHPCVFDYATDDVLRAADSLLTDTVLISTGKQMEVLIQAYRAPQVSEGVFYDVSLKQGKRLGETSTSLDVRGTEADVEFYYNGLWTWNSSIDPTLTAGEQSRSIHAPGAARRVVCAGATTWRTKFVNYLGEPHFFPGGNGRRAAYSSVGPTMDGRTKPDIVAPGTNVISAYSSYFIANPDNQGAPLSSDIVHFDFQGRTYAWASNSGTSMATPIVTGAIALWLQAKPTLTPEEILETFARTSSHAAAPDLPWPNNEYGYGEIDVYRGLLHLLGIDRVEGIATTPIGGASILVGQEAIALSFSHAPAAPFSVSLFTIGGAKVGHYDMLPGQSSYTIPTPHQKGVYVLQIEGARRQSTLIRL